MKKARLLDLLAVLVLIAGAVRFVGAGLLPALRALRGDFAASFPTLALAWLRPDFSTEQVWKPDWTYGPMVHFLTLPLFLAPSWAMVPKLWATANLTALAISFGLACRIAAVPRAPRAPVVLVAGLWLLYQPLVNAFAQGNVEIVEMTLILAALVALPRAQGRLSGALMGVGTMIKFLPLGFLVWLFIRRQWRAALAGAAAILAIAVVTSATLEWRHSLTLKDMTWAISTPVATLHELSVTSLFMHRAGLMVQDGSGMTVHWFPFDRAAAAARAGGMASGLLAAAFSVALFLRRRTPIAAPEIAVLFMIMFMVLPWNHDYYYLFALVPMTILFARGLSRRDGRLLTITAVAYLQTSPPIPFDWLDRVSPIRFVYLFNFFDIPVAGGILLWIAATHQMLTDQPRSLRPRSRPLVWAGSAAALLIAATIGVRAWQREPAPEPPARTATLTFRLPPLTAARGLAMSPDGAALAYVGGEEGARQICVRAIEGETRCLADTTGAIDPFFSPEGTWIGFFAADQLKRVPFNGGAVLTICPAPGGRTASWFQDDTIVFSGPAGILRVGAGGGRPEVVVPVLRRGLVYASPQLLSKTAVLFTIASSVESMSDGNIVVNSLNSGAQRRLIGGSHPHYDESSGRLLYAAGGRLLATVFDPRALDVAGTSVPVADNLLLTSDGGAQFAVGRDRLIYATGGPLPAATRSLVWVDRRGQASPLPLAPGGYDTPRLSPDGRRVAYTVADVRTDVWVFELDTAADRRATFDAHRNETPLWAGLDSLTFAAGGFVQPARPPTVFRQAAIAPRNPREWWAAGRRVRLSSSSADGRYLAGTQVSATTKKDIWIFDGQDRRERPFAETPFNEEAGVFSPDGRWIAFASDESGRSEVYVQAFPEAGPRRQVSRSGGAEPLWSRDGGELFFRQGDTMMAVPWTQKPALAGGLPRAIFTGRYAAGIGEAAYDVSPDGRRFLMLRSEPAPNSTDLRLVTHWASSR